MHGRVRVLIVLFAGTALLFSLGCRTNHSGEAASTGDPQHKAVRHALGTIVSVEEQAHDEQSYDLLPGPRVCFTMDSFAELSGASLSVYEAAERNRQAAQGLRCRNTAIDPSVVRMKAGDRVDVYFTLESAGQISIVRVSAHGVDL